MDQKKLNDMAEELLRLNDEVRTLKDRNATLEAQRLNDAMRIRDLENLLRNK